MRRPLAAQPVAAAAIALLVGAAVAIGGAPTMHAAPALGTAAPSVRGPTTDAAAIPATAARRPRAPLSAPLATAAPELTVPAHTVPADSAPPIAAPATSARAPANGPRSPDGTLKPAVRPIDDPPAALKPPPLRVAPPSGARPGSTPGLRVPGRCNPPPADAAQAESGAGRLQLTAAHRLATGAGQIVAVIDTGVEPHPRLRGRLRGGGDYLTGGNGLTDCDGHGTAVAGIIAASDAGRDDGGVAGIAPDAQVLAIRQSSPSFEVPGPDGATRTAGDVRTLAEAIVLAVRSGASVINISEAVCLRARQAAAQGASVQAALRFAARSDVVVVAAAGNAGVGSCAAAGQEPADQVALPGWYGDDVLTVGAVGPDDAAAEFTVPGPWVDVAAPGTGLRSLAVGGGTTGTGVEGTSFAAPWASGLAALVRERFPKLTAAQVVDRIVATARRPAGGRSVLQLGHGVIDPVAALTTVPDVLSPDLAQPATAVLPGTAARPAPSAPGGPLVPMAACVLVVACCAAVAERMRRSL